MKAVITKYVKVLVLKTMKGAIVATFKEEQDRLCVLSVLNSLQSKT